MVRYSPSKKVSVKIFSNYNYFYLYIKGRYSDKEKDFPFYLGQASDEDDFIDNENRIFNMERFTNNRWTRTFQ